jgi:hypothetical protein
MADGPRPTDPDRRPVWYLAHGLIGDEFALARPERVARRVAAAPASGHAEPHPVGTLFLEPLTQPHEGLRLLRLNDGMKTLLARMQGPGRS